jgi:hypothetical protein
MLGKQFFLIVTLFANVNAKIGRKGSKMKKTLKNIFYKCDLELESQNPILRYFQFGRLHFVKKNSKSLYPNEHTYENYT